LHIRAISTEIKIAFTTGCVVALVVYIFWYSSSAKIHGELVSQRKEQFAKLFADQVRYLNQLSRERGQLAGSAARAGEGVMRLRHKGELSWSESAWDSFLLEDLKSELQRYPEVLRLGIWFEPNSFSPNEKLRGYSATLAPEGVTGAIEAGPPLKKGPSHKESVNRGLNKEGKSAKAIPVEEALPPITFDYHREMWYSALVEKAKLDRSSDDEVWYGPYTDGPALLMTVSKLMRDDDGVILGVATADWELHRLVSDIEQFKPTGTSQAFLIDPRSSSFAAVGSRQDLVQRDVGAVGWGSFALHLPDSEVGVVFPLATGNRWIHKTTLGNGLVFGLVVPEIEALAPIQSVEDNVLTIGVLAFSIIVVLMVPVSGAFLRPVRSSIELLRRVSSGGWSSDTELAVLNADMVLLTKAVDQAVRYVTSVEDAVRAVSSGHTELPENSAQSTDRAIVSREVIDLMATCRMFTEDVRLKLARLGDGDTRDPVWQREYSGFWRIILRELETFSATYTGPLREISTVLDSIADGEMSARLDGPYTGEFAVVQQSLNRALDRISSRSGSLRRTLPD
jgi:methyl-accepting chemotaxis protein